MVESKMNTTLSVKFQVEATSIFLFLGSWSCHPDFLRYAHDITRIYLRIHVALRTFDLQIYALSLTSGPRA